jgi:hypothetical protein
MMVPFRASLLLPSVPMLQVLLFGSPCHTLVPYVAILSSAPLICHRLFSFLLL